MNLRDGIAALGVCICVAACTSAADTSSDRFATDATAAEGTSNDVAAGNDTSGQVVIDTEDGTHNCPAVGQADADGLDSVELEQIGVVNGRSVSAALYPLAPTEGDPWSQWGQGVVLPDGRFVSAVGDHLGRDGTSWFYEYDPRTNALTRTAEVSAALGHEAGDWGYGKVHAPMLLSTCDTVIAATYWGTRRDLVLGDTYQGDHLISYDPSTHTIESMGVPVVGFGIPSIAISPDRRWIFGEAVDPVSDPDAGSFFVADAETGDVVHVDDNAQHVGFRNVMVSSGGEGFYAVGGRDLIALDPTDGSTRSVDDVLPGAWLRASTAAGPDGSVFGVTRDPDSLFRLDADGEFTDMGALSDYVASLALSPDGRTLYFVPGAHGSGKEYGTPLVAVDVETGTRTELVRLNDLIEPALGVRAGGSYNVAIDPNADRLYIGLNAGPIDDEEDSFGRVVLAVVELD